MQQECNMRHRPVVVMKSSRLLGSMDKIGMTMAAAFWGCLEDLGSSLEWWKEWKAAVAAVGEGSEFAPRIYAAEI